MATRTLQRVIVSIPTSDGAGVRLTRVIGQPQLPDLDPFLMLDEFGTDKPEAEPEPPPKGDTWDESDYEYFFGDYLDDGYRPRAQQEIRELPPIESTPCGWRRQSALMLPPLRFVTCGP